jgi:hypothetical protein
LGARGRDDDLRSGDFFSDDAADASDDDADAVEARGDANARTTSRCAARADGVDDAAVDRGGGEFVPADASFDLDDGDFVEDAAAWLVANAFIPLARVRPRADAAGAAAAVTADLVTVAAFASHRNATRNQARPSRFDCGYIARSAASISAAEGKPSAWASASVR